MLNWLNSFASVSLRPREPTSPTFVSRLAGCAAGLHRAGNKKGLGVGFLRGDKELGFLIGRAVVGRTGH